jgi:hypothetical protein
MSPKITIPSEHYVGMRSQYQESLPLAFITPNGNDKAALKRIQTVDSWSGRSKDGYASAVITNEPMQGFKLTCNIRRGGRYGSGDKWHIEDPRGFVLEINSTNLAYLLESCVIENGTILNSCVWARQRGNNVLLATDTDLYQNAVTLTSLDGISVSMKDVEKGYDVILKSGVSAKYLGKYHLLKKSWGDNDWFDLHSPQHLLLTNDNKPKLLSYSNPKISKIETKNALSDKDSEQMVNDHLAAGGQTDGWYPLYGVFSKKPINWSIKLKPVDDIDYALESSTQRSLTLIIELKNHVYGIFNPYYSNPDYVMDTVNIDLIDQGQMSYKLIKKKSIKGWDTSQMYIDKDQRHFDRNDIINVYECFIEATTSLDNQVLIKF